MAIVITPLTATQVQKAKPGDKAWYLFDGQGLCLQIKPNGNKYWHCRYKRPTTGSATTVSLGAYPHISLADARKEHQKILALLKKGIDPKALEREAEAQVKQAEESRFRVVAEKWFKTQKEGKVTEEHAEQIWSSLANHVLPSVGDIPVTELKAPTLIAALKPLEAKGALETLRRIVQRVNNVMEYAVNLGLMDINPLYRVSQVFASPEVTNMPSISPKRLDELVQRVEAASLAPLTRYMIWWQLLTLVRPGEAAGARWSEIDEKENLWIIPAARMKKRRIHKVPLTPEMLWIIGKLRPITGHTLFLFPGRIKNSQPMNSETVNKALRRMGFTGELVSHGFRALGCTAMIDAGFPSDVVDAVLAHVEAKKMMRPYNRDAYLKQRVELMNWWGCQISESMQHAAMQATMSGGMA
ncbi:DUF4102 domain-containing protein [Salmonella enterica subsp. enterica serovar Mississippi]|nr:DUF4102 domain-containing protein [Salmonella enterica subsp. enterica serovar Mississippi]